MDPELCERLRSTVASNPHILALCALEHEPHSSAVVDLWAVIPNWNYDIEVKVMETMVTLMGENPKELFDPMIVTWGIKDSMIPVEATQIYQAYQLLEIPSAELQETLNADTDALLRSLPKQKASEIEKTIATHIRELAKERKITLDERVVEAMTRTLLLVGKKLDEQL